MIDEAVRMADMGFLPAVKRILDATAKRQTALFRPRSTATSAVLTKKYQHDPARHEVEGVENDGMDAEHRFEEVAVPRPGATWTAEVIGTEGATIVFCRTRHGADKLAKKLEHTGDGLAPIHGGLSQNKRDRALQAFQRGSVQALIATDVAARGIHVDDVACVVHFDPPEDAKTYVHRSGRTARKGASVAGDLVRRGDQQRDSRKMRRELGFETGPEPHRPSGARQHRARRPGAARGNAAHRRVADPSVAAIGSPAEADVSIRLACVDEIEVVQVRRGGRGHAVRRHGLLDGVPDEPADVALLRDAVADERLWVAVAGGSEIVGFALARWCDDDAHLQELDVLPEWGRRGIGRRLVAAVVAWATGKGRERVTLTTFTSVPWNAPFYERLGFVVLAPGDWTAVLAGDVGARAGNGPADGSTGRDGRADDLNRLRDCRG